MGARRKQANGSAGTKTTAKTSKRGDPRQAPASSRAPAIAEAEVIEVVKAREHNLKVDHLTIPKRKLVVFTGVSGSGKSSLAFDTLFAEGQRRYVESLSAYARQFLGRMDRPDVERLRGLSPTVAIEQKSASGNPRSTVGTITEIYDYLRVLFARVGVQHCYVCGKAVKGRSAEEVVEDVYARASGRRALVLAPIVTHRKGEFGGLLEELGGRGFVRVRIDGAVHRIDAAPALDKKRKHTLELVVDRVTVQDDDRQRVTEAIELGLREGDGVVRIEGAGDDADLHLEFSESRSCCGISYPKLGPQSFSFNSPLGMCPHCNGLGTRLDVDPELVVPDTSLSIRDGAIATWRTAMERGEGWTFRIAEAAAEAVGVDLDKPWRKLPKKKREQILYGIEGKKIQVTWGSEETSSQGSWSTGYNGVIPTLLRRYRETSSERARDSYRSYFREQACELCDGQRLRQESLGVKIAGEPIARVTSRTVREASDWIEGLDLTPSQARIAAGVKREISSRLRFLLDVGLEYLTLDRGGPTLSGGEAQRIRLASQLGSELSGVLYVLDEPSIGLHQRDNARLIGTLEKLRDLGNSVLVVEHDEDTIRAADHVVDFGPGAGMLGGKVTFSGPPSELAKATGSLTADYMVGRRRIETPATRREARGWIEIRGAREHNLQRVTARFPTGCFTAVTGVSGAGKSSLVNGILLPAVAHQLHGSADRVGRHDGIDGLDALDKVIAIDQQPIGRTPRSNPGTYTKAFDEIRNLLAQLPDARARGFSAGRFSFNVKGGRCEACQGDGVVKVEMHFLADVFVPCEVCHGRRYNAQTLEIRYRGKSIADLLDTSIEECREIFAAHPKMARILDTLLDVGLGYLKLGQPAPTLSGGEAQRVKLSRELAKKQTGRTLYVLDEPTTGLHFEDVRRLLLVLEKLVEAGNTVIVVEHNLDVVRRADWVVDLGPEGGAGGGRLVAEGTPEQVARTAGSHTGAFLAGMLAEPGRRRPPRRR